MNLALPSLDLRAIAGLTAMGMIVSCLLSITYSHAALLCRARTPTIHEREQELGDRYMLPSPPVSANEILLRLPV